ncbi:MAG: alcohol dehydrogenase catalytic domain-containing protein [Acidothermales bacterium]|nr:alcohol dehydrogenase catalytic domain-containing protein [Acidothermales bacterium]
MQALRLADLEKLEVTEVPRPDAGERALVAVDRAGICGSDVKIVRGITQVAYPRILGHELVGTVVRSARGGHIAEGTRVLVDPFISCGRCVRCRGGRSNLCGNGALLGREVDGGFAEFVAVDDGRMLAIPDGISRDDAGFLQVLGVCVHAQTLVDVFPGQTGVVVGLGVGGLLHLQLLRTRGVRRIVGVTRSAAKRALAERFGATVTCHPDDAEDCVAELTGGAGADVVVESVGTVETLAQAIRLAGGGATVLLYGVTRAEAGRVDYVQLYLKELELVSSRAALIGDYARAVDLLADGVVQVAPLLSERFRLDRGTEAFDALRTRPEVVKVLLEVG